MAKYVADPVTPLMPNYKPRGRSASADAMYGLGLGLLQAWGKRNQAQQASAAKVGPDGTSSNERVIKPADPTGGTSPVTIRQDTPQNAQVQGLPGGGSGSVNDQYAYNYPTDAVPLDTAQAQSDAVPLDTGQAQSAGPAPAATLNTSGTLQGPFGIEYSCFADGGMVGGHFRLGKKGRK